jgi:hypothetical protein
MKSPDLALLVHRYKHRRTRANRWAIVSAADHIMVNLARLIPCAADREDAIHAMTVKLYEALASPPEYAHAAWVRQVCRYALIDHQDEDTQVRKPRRSAGPRLEFVSFDDPLARSQLPLSTQDDQDEPLNEDTWFALYQDLGD